MIKAFIKCLSDVGNHDDGIAMFKELLEAIIVMILDHCQCDTISLYYKEKLPSPMKAFLGVETKTCIMII